MKKITLRKYIFISVFACFLFLFPIQIFAQADETPAQENIEIYFFVQQGCSFCAKLEKQFDEWLKSDYPQLNIKKFDIFERENLQLLNNAQKAYNFHSQGVPTIFIGEEKIVGAKIEEIENAIKKCIDQQCPKPSDIIQNYIDRHAANSQNATADENGNELNEKNKITIIIVGIIIIGIICLFIYLHINDKKK